jgi:multiple sugar transport system permease protein
MSQWNIGWYLPLWLGGLQSIPTELYEAVEMDGGGFLSRLRHVTIPMLSPLILYNLMMNIIWAAQLFTEPFVMTSGMGGQAPTGGPQFAALTYLLHLYNNAFIYMKMGLASAMGWIMFIVVLGITFLVFKSSPMWVYYEAERRN